jgi:hypothetical protein
MTRRDLIFGGPRLWLLAWRLSRGSALPGCAATLLAWLDRWALRIHREAE